MKYCPKCGQQNPDDANFCARCAFYFNCPPKQQAKAPDMTEIERERDLYLAAWSDKQFVSLSTKYYRLIEEIESDYSVFINNLGGKDAEAKLEKKCVEGTILFHELIPFWKKYEQSIPHSCPAFKRLSMIREKRGDYEGAALACVQQMRLGVYGDGSKAGMRGRLARLVRKGNLSKNKTIMHEVNKYLEI